MYCTTSSAELPGKVLIRWHLTDRYYKDSVNAFEFVVPAEVFSVSPSVTVGSRSTIVTVSGTGFAATDQLGCKVEPTWTPAMFVSSSRIICTVEKHAPGRVDLQVTVNGVDYSTEGLVFEYLPDIGVRAVTPSTGSHVGGYSITVQGSGFDSRLYLVCMFGSLRSKALFVDSHAVTCEVPKVESDQGVRVRVVDDAHTLTGDEDRGVFFEFSASASIETLLPSVGLAVGSGVVFVVGTAFRAGPELACKFGDTTSQSAYMSSSLVRCHMPSLGRGKTSVQVSFDGVTYISGPEFQVIEKVTLDGITPSRGPIQGSNLVTLNGAGFEQSDAYFCVFGFHPNMTNGRVVSSSSILCTAPKQSGPVRVHVSLQAHGRIALRW